MEKKEYITPKSKVKFVEMENHLLAGSPLDAESLNPSTIPVPDEYTGEYSAKEVIDFIMGD